MVLYLRMQTTYTTTTQREMPQGISNKLAYAGIFTDCRKTILCSRGMTFFQFIN